ncbi:MAG: cation-transporting P-type ATPase, partial [Rhodobacteraceae bacterium]|nr:cation-transporting P-type ATPase [Paracoccaceae bacterium]
MTDRLHALPEEEVLRLLGTGRDGLASDEAARRLMEAGPNRLPAAPARGAVRRFLAQFGNLIVYVLIGSAVVTALLGHWLDAGVIAAVVLVNAVIGFIQEGRAENALAAIRGMLSPRAAILRDGRRETVAAADLVPGDIVLV